MDDEDSAVHTELTNISSNNIKLILKRGGFIVLGFNSGHDLIFTGIWSNNKGQEPSLSSLNLSS